MKPDNKVNILDLFPTLDDEVLAFEVEKQIFYDNIVCFFNDALKNNVFFNNPNYKSEYFYYENKYLEFFEELFIQFKIVKYDQKLNFYNQYSNYKDFEKDIMEGLR